MTPPTIYALSTGAGRAGVAIIRISGSRTTAILDAFVGQVPEPRLAALCKFRSPRDGAKIDRGIVLFFPGPNSFTGEDLAEFHVHGSPAVVRRMFDELSAQEDTELAAPGAFTERAFINGKLDLTQVEGLADLIDANTDIQRQQALAQSSGILRERSTEWRKTLIHALALLEAVLDFSDEGDVTDEPIQEAHKNIKYLAADLQTALADTARADSIRNGFKVAIVGPPNAGKSSLLNALAARDVAIVTPKAGTTRDTIEVQLELGGLPVTVIDTAGLRETDNAIEQEGIARARAAAASADLVLNLMDVTNPALRPISNPESWTVLNKSDLLKTTHQPNDGESLISTRTGDGIDTLLDRLTVWCSEKVSSGEPALVTRERQRQCIETCVNALQHFGAANLDDLELRAEDLRTAAVALGQLTGEIDAEDVLDDIFAGFCIGK